MTEAEKWAEYDLAEHALSILISHCSARLYAEKMGEAPDQEQIATWRNERTAWVQLRRQLSVDDMATIKRVNEQYGPKAKALSNRQ